VEPLPAPLPLDVPDGLLEPGLVEPLEPLPLPPVWAAANAGARAMTATKSVRINFCIGFPSCVFDRSSEPVAGSWSNIWALGMAGALEISPKSNHANPHVPGSAEHRTRPLP